jgi:type I site-specific restriction endonuclease
MDSTLREEAKRHIEKIRKDKFGIELDGTKHPNSLERDLRAALRNLAEELNAKETHFILELLQNAEDNIYPDGAEPELRISVEDADPSRYYQDTSVERTLEAIAAGIMRILLTLAAMQKIIDAEKSDLFDVLAHVAYAMPPLTREVRAANAKVHINTRFSAKQQVFLDFVLSHYVTVGVEELDQAKLTPLLRLKYHDSIADAVADLGKPDEINHIFAGFQKYLYQPVAAGHT